MSDTKPRSNQTREYKCKICEFTSSIPGDLAAHIDSEHPPAEQLELLKSNIQKLIATYETVKPVIHYNIPYALRFYNIKRKRVRDKDLFWKRKVISLFAPTLILKSPCRLWSCILKHKNTCLKVNNVCD